MSNEQTGITRTKDTDIQIAAYLLRTVESAGNVFFRRLEGAKNTEGVFELVEDGYGLLMNMLNEMDKIARSVGYPIPGQGAEQGENEVNARGE